MADLSATPRGIFSRAVLGRLPVIFLPAALMLGAVVGALYYQDLTNEHTLYEQAAAHRVDLHADIIRREVKSVASDLLYLANQAILSDFLGGHAAGRQVLLDEYALFCRQRGLYDQIRYLDATGHERIRINYNDGRPVIVPQRQLQTKADRYYFVQAMPLGRGQIFISPFDLNVEHGDVEQPLKPMIRFATPVFDRRGVKRGILILNYLGAALLDKLARVSAGFPGAVWLLNRDGFFLRGPAPRDEWGFMFGHNRTFATSFPDDWPHLLEKRRGQFRSQRGLLMYRTLSARARTPVSTPTGAAGQADADAHSTWLIVVAHIPPEILDARAHAWLEKLLLLYGVVLVLVLALAWYLAYAGALRHQHEQHLADSAARLRTLSTRLLTAQEDERRSLSRDLHDELGQVVTSVTLDLQRAAQAGDRQRTDDLIARALHGSNCLLARIQEISARLRPRLLDDLGLKDAVQSLLREYEKRTGIAVRAELRFEERPVPPAISENIYRILQEALTNVSKHARAAEVFVALVVAGGLVTLSVGDNGIGLASTPPSGKQLGILGMHERAELLNGTFHLTAQPGRGVVIEVKIPLAQE